MNDPFAMLDPVHKPGSSSDGTSNFSRPQGPVNRTIYNPFEHLSGARFENTIARPQQQQQAMYLNGANFMTQQGPPAFGGLGASSQQFVSYSPNQQQMPTSTPVMMMPSQMQMQSQMQSHVQPMGNNNFTNLVSYGDGPIMQGSLKNVMTPLDPFATSPASAVSRAPEPTSTPSLSFQKRDVNSTIVDFDPFSPKGSTPRTPFDFPDATLVTTTSPGSNDRLPSFGNKRLTQEEQRSQLSFTSEGFATVSAQSSQHKISLRDVSPNAPNHSEDNTSFFLEGNDAFMHSAFANLDDFDTNTVGQSSGTERSTLNDLAESTSRAENCEIAEECGKGEYDVCFESGRKLGVLMERVDVLNSANKRKETAVVKLVVENGAADRVGVSIGSTVVAINRKSVESEPYLAILNLIKAAPRPLRMRFERGSQNMDTTQGNILTRISNGTFSVGNLTSGNASWTTKYFAFGGSKMDVLQLFVSRAAYHECVIALYEKRGVHTQIQSFRLCRDHKISPIKCKIYKGYGNLHYFSLTVPSLRFVAAKFASDDYGTIKNIWSNTYDAIELKKRMAY